MIMLIRWRHWWYNKIPFAILAFLLTRSYLNSNDDYFYLLSLYTIIICCVANFGFGLNEIFDIDEDTASCRANVAVANGVTFVGLVCFFSAVLAITMSAFIGGIRSIILVIAVLLLPLAYSCKPIRLKERLFGGIIVDALAAHVFPVMLSLSFMQSIYRQDFSINFQIAAISWALVLGVRGIVSHQLHSELSDRRGGLRTIVHVYGRSICHRTIVFVLVPCETILLLYAVYLTNAGAIVWMSIAIYFLFELRALIVKNLIQDVLDPSGHAFVPVIDDMFYKFWGTIIFLLNVEVLSFKNILSVLTYLALFYPTILNFKPFRRA